jgi:hypothetical protein
MESRARGIWSWVHVLFMIFVRLAAVVAAFAIGLQWGAWVGSIAALALLMALGPTAVVLIYARLGAGAEQAKKLVVWLFRIRLAVLLCLIGASVAIGTVGLTLFCVICAVLAGLHWVMMELGLARDP